MKKKSVLVVGAAGIDTKGRARQTLVPGTSNPGDIRTAVGGVGHNVAENLVRLGVPATLLSAVGDDEAGRTIMAESSRCGVDVSQVLVSKEQHTSAYLAILDGNGSLSVSVDDMEIMATITPNYIYARRALIRKSGMVFIDSNLSPPTIAAVIKLAQRYRVPICADPISTTLAGRIQKHLRELYMVTPNVPEAEILVGSPISNRQEALDAAKYLVNAGVQIAAISLAEMGVAYATPEESGHTPALQSEIIDLTGAGDALTATIIFGLLNDFPVSEAVRLGVSAAALTIRCRETVCPFLSLERLYDELVV